MIKRFNPDFSVSISHELAYMRETPEGGYVAHGDYASLFSELESVKADRDAQQKRADALAVENAALIEGLRCIYTTALISQDSGPKILYSWDFANQPAEEIEMWISDAKETDAALAAIEARGVEMATVKMQESGAQTFGDCYIALVQFANELREGK
ncbi:hypothetical protein ACN2AS_05480 [Serratia liquefaciens]|uniref:hypothetical protein n=1 Tax=Serratia liquefaciens TaxID=614 RepID=UPI003AF378DB